MRRRRPAFLFFFNDTATTEIYTLSLHDALPISAVGFDDGLQTTMRLGLTRFRSGTGPGRIGEDRKSTRLNSSHQIISYAVFCLKKKKNMNIAYDYSSVEIITPERTPLHSNALPS